MHQTPDFGTPSAALAFLRANPDYIPTDADLASAEQAQRDASADRLCAQDLCDVATARVMRALRERAHGDIPRLTSAADIALDARNVAGAASDTANALLALINARRNRIMCILCFQ